MTDPVTAGEMGSQSFLQTVFCEISLEVRPELWQDDTDTEEKNIERIEFLATRHRQETLYTAQVHNTAHNTAHCKLHTANCTHNTAHNTAQCTLQTAHSTLQTAHCRLLFSKTEVWN